jgi:hypothetical protein
VRALVEALQSTDTATELQLESHLSTVGGRERAVLRIRYIGRIQRVKARDRRDLGSSKYLFHLGYVLCMDQQTENRRTREANVKDTACIHTHLAKTGADFLTL